MEGFLASLSPDARAIWDLVHVVQSVDLVTDRFPIVGYNLRLATGWTVSVRMGPSTYSDYRWDTGDMFVGPEDVAERDALATKWLRSERAEVAAFDAEGWWWDWTGQRSVRSSTDGDCVLGFQTTGDLMRLIQALPDLRPPDARGLTRGHSPP